MPFLQEAELAGLEAKKEIEIGTAEYHEWSSRMTTNVLRKPMPEFWVRRRELFPICFHAHPFLDAEAGYAVGPAALLQRVHGRSPDRASQYVCSAPKQRISTWNVDAVAEQIWARFG
jgi:hypothetical protein